MTLWLIKKLPILIPILLMLGICLVGVMTVLSTSISNGFGIVDNQTAPVGGNNGNPGNPGNPVVINPPAATSDYCLRVGDAGSGNPFRGYPTNDGSLQSPGYVGTDFCDPTYPFAWGHEGLDFLYWTGIPIVATADATVQQAGYDQNLGNVVVLCVADWCARFGHMSILMVSAGETVVRGQQIGAAGNTGNYTTGSHLHYDIYNADGFWDPLPTLN